MDKYQKALDWIKEQFRGCDATEDWDEEEHEVIELMQELVDKENLISKEDAIVDLQNLKLTYANNTWNQHHFETFDIAIKCIQHCIDEETKAKENNLNVYDQLEFMR